MRAYTLTCEGKEDRGMTGCIAVAGGVGTKRVNASTSKWLAGTIIALNTATSDHTQTRSIYIYVINIHLLCVRTST